MIFGSDHWETVICQFESYVTGNLASLPEVSLMFLGSWRNNPQRFTRSPLITAVAVRVDTHARSQLNRFGVSRAK